MTRSACGIFTDSKTFLAGIPNDGGLHLIRIDTRQTGPDDFGDKSRDIQPKAKKGLKFGDIDEPHES